MSSQFWSEFDGSGDHGGDFSRFNHNWAGCHTLMLRFLILIVVWNSLKSKPQEVEMWDVFTKDFASVKFDCASSLDVEKLFIVEHSLCSILFAVQCVWDLEYLKQTIFDLNNVVNTSLKQDSFKIFKEAEVIVNAISYNIEHLNFFIRVIFLSFVFYRFLRFLWFLFFQSSAFLCFIGCFLSFFFFSFG